MPAQQPMFDKYGGFAAVRTIVYDLYQRIRQDDEINGYFENVDFSRIVNHQTKFVSSVMGGPASYTDEQLRKLHQHLPITGGDFDRLMAILGDALAESGVEADDAALILARMQDRRDLVVNA